MIALVFPLLSLFCIYILFTVIKASHKELCLPVIKKISKNKFSSIMILFSIAFLLLLACLEAIQFNILLLVRNKLVIFPFDEMFFFISNFFYTITILWFLILKTKLLQENSKTHKIFSYLLFAFLMFGVAAFSGCSLFEFNKPIHLFSPITFFVGSFFMKIKLYMTAAHLIKKLKLK